MANVPTVERLTQLFCYDRDTGVVTRRIPVKGRQPGSVVGYRHSRNTGRLSTIVDGKKMPVARICWALITGQHAAGYVDHINGDPSDNRACNLRDVSPAVNNQNRRKANRRSKTGVMGVIQIGDKFRVSMSFQGKTLSVGCFHAADEAHAYFLSLKRRLHDGCEI